MPPNKVPKVNSFLPVSCKTVKPRTGHSFFKLNYDHNLLHRRLIYCIVILNGLN